MVYHKYCLSFINSPQKKTNPKIFVGKFPSKPGLGVAVNSFTIRVNVC